MCQLVGLLILVVESRMLATPARRVKPASFRRGIVGKKASLITITQSKEIPDNQTLQRLIFPEERRL